MFKIQFYQYNDTLVMYLNYLQLLCQMDFSHKRQLPSGWSFHLRLTEFLLDVHANGAFREPALL